MRSILFIFISCWFAASLAQQISLTKKVQVNEEKFVFRHEPNYLKIIDDSLCIVLVEDRFLIFNFNTGKPKSDLNFSNLVSNKYFSYFAAQCGLKETSDLKIIPPLELGPKIHFDIHPFSMAHCQLKNKNIYADMAIRYATVARDTDIVVSFLKLLITFDLDQVKNNKFYFFNDEEHNNAAFEMGFFIKDSTLITGRYKRDNNTLHPCLMQYDIKGSRLVFNKDLPVFFPKSYDRKFFFQNSFYEDGTRTLFLCNEKNIYRYESNADVNPVFYENQLPDAVHDQIRNFTFVQDNIIMHVSRINATETPGMYDFIYLYNKKSKKITQKVSVGVAGTFINLDFKNNMGLMISKEKTGVYFQKINLQQ